MRIRSFYFVAAASLLLAIFPGCSNDLFSANLPTNLHGSALQADLLLNNQLLFQAAQQMPESNPNAVEDPALAVAISQPADWIYAGIITPDESTINATLNNIPHQNQVQNIVLLATTPPSSTIPSIGAHTYAQEGALQSLNISFDQTLIQKLEEKSLIQKLDAVPQESPWNRAFMWSFGQKFPQASFLIVEISPNQTSEQSQKFATALKVHLPEKSLVIALARPLENNNSQLKNYYTTFIADTLTHADLAHYPDLPLHNLEAVRTLGNYAQQQKTLTPSFADISTQTTNILFQKGDPSKAPRSASITFFGDIMLGRYVRHLMDTHTPDYPFQKIDNTYLRANNLLVANLEGPVTSKAVKHIEGMNFGFFPDSAELLSRYHFDILSLANNHALDKGSQAWEESRQILMDANITPFGHPNDILPESIAYHQIGEQKIAFLGLEDVNTPLDGDAAASTIQTLKNQGHKVIVFPHWGQEYLHRPNRRQQQLAYQFINAGAFAVIGHHPHVEQTYENYKGHPIFYSLGNAIFDQYWSEDTQKGLTLAMTIGPQQTQIHLFPITINRSQPQLMPADQKQQFLERFATFGTYTEQELQQIESGTITIPTPAL